MGLFVAEDGHYQGWLAALLCCVAAVDEDEHPKEWSRSRPSTRAGSSICTEQPTVAQLPPYPHPQQQKIVVLNDHKETRSLSSRHDSREFLTGQLSPVETSVFRPSDEEAAKIGHTTKRPSMSAPSSFRRLDYNGEVPRHNLIPLKLAPVILRKTSSDEEASPVESVKSSGRHQRSDSTQDLLAPSQQLPAGLPSPELSYRLSRESPFQRLQRQSIDVIAKRQSLVVQQQSSRERLSSTIANPRSTMPLSAQSSSNSLRKSIVDDSASSTHSRSSNESAAAAVRVRRKHSGTLSLRGDDTDVAAGLDKDAIELNTIHEERKPDSPRPRLQTAKSDGHIPAVAPSMQVNARSETLNDIGSILSRPHGSTDLKKNFDELLEEPDERQPRSVTQVAKLRSRSSSRVSGWLSSIRNAQTSMPDSPSNNDSYNNNSSINDKHTVPVRVITTLPRVSRSSSVASPDSPLPSALSSPVSKGHSRTFTAESRITSPPSTTQESVDEGDRPLIRSRNSAIARTERMCEDEGWPSLIPPPHEVGVAL